MSELPVAPSARPCPRSPEGGYHRFKLPAAAQVVQACCVYCGVERVFDAQVRRMPYWLRRRVEVGDAPHG